MIHLTPLILRPLIARPVRTLLTVFGVTLGVAVVLAISITNRNTLESLNTVFNEASGKAHLVVIHASDDQGFPQDILRRVAAVPGVQSAIPSVQSQTNLADDVITTAMDVSLLGAGAGGLSLYGIDPRIDHQAREYKIVSGVFLGAVPDAYEVVLVEDYAIDKSLSVGRDLTILTPQGTERLRIVGLMSKEGPGLLNNGAFGIIPLGTAQKLFSRSDKLDQIDLVAAPQFAGGAGLDNLKAVLQDRLGDDYSVIYPATRGERVTQMLDGYQMGFSMFSVIALFVGAFLIFNAFSMNVVERTREIGMLRTIGMTRRQVLAQVLLQAGLMGLLGALLGVGGGFLLSRGLIRVMELLLAQELQRPSLPILDSLATSVLVGLAVTLIAAALPAWQASRISPLEALRIRGQTKDGWLLRRGWVAGAPLLGLSYLFLYHVRLPQSVQGGLSNLLVLGMLLGATLLVPFSIDALERLLRPLIHRLYGSEGQIGSGNIRRSKLRTTLTVGALMVGVAMILSIRAITSAFSYDVSDWMDNYIGGDLYIGSTVPMRADLARRLEAVEGVAAVAPTRYLEVTWITPIGDKERITLMAVDPASYRRVTNFVFAGGQGEPDALLNRLGDGDVIFVSSVLAERYGLSPGDRVSLQTRRGQQSFVVAAVVIDFYNQGLVMHSSWKDLRRYFGINDVSSFLVKVETGYALDVVRERITRLYGASRHLTVESNQAIKERARDLIAGTSTMFDVLALIAMIVGALGVVNTLTMNILERTRELGMLRSVGMTRRQVAKMILAEAGVMGCIGGLFGLAVGLFLSRTILNAMNAMTGYEIAYVVPTQGIFVSLFIALVVAEISALWPAWRAAGIRMIEAIQFE